MNSDADWAATAQQFQQDFGESWAKTLQSFSGLGLGGTSMQMPNLPQLSFAPEKLQALQQAYLTEAADLWNKGLTATPPGDKRFASDAWMSNPVSAFSAAVYLLNARTLLGLAEAADTDPEDQGAAALRGRAVDGCVGPEQLHVPQCRGAEESRGNAGREHRQAACRTCSRTSSRGTSR